MIELNGKRFARTQAEFTESLFHPGGTCVGFYRKIPQGVELMNMRRERIGVVNRHGVLCCATRLDDGRYWYNFATIREIGEHASYTRQREECAAALAAVA